MFHYKFESELGNHSAQDEHLERATRKIINEVIGQLGDSQAGDAIADLFPAIVSVIERWQRDGIGKDYCFGRSDSDHFGQFTLTLTEGF